MTSRRADLLALLALGLLATMFLWPVLGGGEALSGGDIVNQYLPYRHAANEAIRHGEAPWWDSHSFSGQPAVANMNLALFYPPNLISLGVPTHRWFGWTVWLHVLWGLAGAHLFFRRVGVGVPAAMIGSATLWVSGFFIFRLWAGIILFHQAGAWWPWAMMGVLILARPGHLAGSALLAVSLAMMFLSGAPQIAFYAGLTAGAFGLYLAITSLCRLRLLVGMAIAVVLAGMLVQVQLLPTREWSAQSQRASWEGEADWEQKTVDSLRVRSLALALVPDLCGNPTDEGLYWGTTEGFHEVVPAVMTPPLLLLLLWALASTGWRSRSTDACLSAPEPRHWVIFHLIFGALALWAAFGVRSHLFRALWITVPGISEFRVPSRMSIIALWCLACLTAVAFDRLWRAAFGVEGEDMRNARRRWALWGWAMAGVGVAVTILFCLIDIHRLCLRLGMAPGLDPHWLQGLSPSEYLTRHIAARPELLDVARHALVRWGVAVSVTGLGVAIWTTWRRLWLVGLALLLTGMIETAPLDMGMKTQPAEAFSEISFGESHSVTAIREHIGEGRMLCLDNVYAFYNVALEPSLYPNRPVMLGLHDARGYDPIVSHAYARWMNRLSGVHPETPARGLMTVGAIMGWELLRQLNVTVVLSHAPIDDPHLEPVHRGESGLMVHRVLEPGGAGRWVPEGRIATPDPLINLYLSEGNDLARFDPSRQVMIEGGLPTPGTVGGSTDLGIVNLVERAPSRAVYSVEAEGAGYLVTDIPYHPGWRVNVNGEGWNAECGNTLWLTVPLSAGSHIVTLTFLPTSLVRGALLSLAGLTLLLGLLAKSRQQKREGGSEPPSEDGVAA